MAKKKLAIVGAGNAACITAMTSHLYGVVTGDPDGNSLYDPIDIYYDPEVPISRVGQGTLPGLTHIMSQVLGATFYEKENYFKGKLKSGVLYENWGKSGAKHFHPFIMSHIAIHYEPKQFSKAILECGLFNVIEKNIKDPEKEIDADTIWDCRGLSHKQYLENKDDYLPVINPLNAAILAKGPYDPELHYTRTVATPNGWTFVVPNFDSTSIGYLYNSDITPRNRAEKNLTKMFDVEPDGHLNFSNYVAKSMFRGERTILNGNKLAFVEPLEANSSPFYQDVSGIAWHAIFNILKKEEMDRMMHYKMAQIQNFLLWHYDKGSKYDTEFWRYAKKISKNTWERDIEFLRMIEHSRSKGELEFYNRGGDPPEDVYGQWHANSFKNWDRLI